MEEIIIKDKQRYLNDNYPFDEIPKMNDRRRCIHCDNIINVAEYKVFRDDDGNELIYCPNAPDCDGTVIDWFPLP